MATCFTIDNLRPFERDHEEHLQCDKLRGARGTANAKQPVCVKAQGEGGREDLREENEEEEDRRLDD